MRRRSTIPSWRSWTPTPSRRSCASTPTSAAWRRFTIDRPAKRNAFNDEVIAALREAFETVAGADGVRVVFHHRLRRDVLSRGGPRVDARRGRPHRGPTTTKNAMRMGSMLKHLHDLPMLTVALIEGAAFGGGAGLVAACDMAIATRAARFSFSEVKLGLVAATISPYVVAAIGPRRARGLFASARVFDAERALAIGLVDEVVADAAGLLEAREAIARDALPCAPDAVRASKHLVDHVRGPRPRPRPDRIYRPRDRPRPRRR